MEEVRENIKDSKPSDPWCFDPVFETKEQCQKIDKYLNIDYSSDDTDEEDAGDVTTAHCIIVDPPI